MSKKISFLLLLLIVGFSAIAQPKITSFTPTSAKPGDVVTIAGTNFNTTTTNNIVFFGATKANVTAATTTSLTVTVPTGATYNYINVLNTGTALMGSSANKFIPIFSPTKTSIGTGDFAAKVDFATGTNPFSIAIGDIDGDGKPDLAIANSGSNTVSVYRNISSTGSIVAGSFAAKVDFTTGSLPYAVAIGDLDGDGKPDLVVANNISNTLSVLRNTSSSGSIGSGSFAAKVDFATGISPISVSIGDLDGDGKLDLAVANNHSNTVSVLRNTSSSGSIGSGSFAANVDLTTGTSPRSVAIGDLDGDGKPDLVTANYNPNTVSVLRNTSSSGSIGLGSFAANVDFATGTTPTSVAIGDLDGDGKPDLAVANNIANTVSVFRNTSSSGSIGSGSFAAKVDFTTGTNPYNVAIGDLDGDGKPDLAVANYNSNSVSILRNTSSSGSIVSGSFATNVDFTTGASSYAVAIGDLDGDGKPDLAVSNLSDNSVSVIRNNPQYPPTINSFTPTSGNVGSLVTITGTNLSSPTGLTIGGVSAIPISNTGTSLVAMVMPGATTGAVSVTTAGGTANGTGNFTVTASQAPNTQQGSKLVGTGAVGAPPTHGWSVSLSADGNTAIVGGFADNSGSGAAWVYTRSGGSWSQQGSKLVGTGAVGNPNQGYSVSLSADGNTAIVGGYGDNGGAGAAWVFTRSGGSWSQQGSKLVGTGAVGNAQQGASVSLSADGNTAIVGGYGDNGATGAAWVYTRSGGSWSQQGSKLVGTGARGSARQGNSVSLSADGNTAIVGGFADNNFAGAAWVYTLSAGIWTQQGSKLVGTGAVGSAQQGASVSLSADGNTAILGGFTDNSGAGAAWVYTRSGGSWSQQGSKLVGTGAVGNAGQGRSLSLSADGNTAIVGGFADNSGVGAAWVYTRSGGSWSQQGSKLVGTGTVGSAQQGISVSLSADGNTTIVGGFADNSFAGAAWVYVAVTPTITTTGTLAAFSTCSGTASTQQSFTISGVNLTNDITVTVPTGFEVSTTSGASFGSSVTLTQTGGTIASTTIYVRLTNTASGTPSGNIACTSTGATTQNISASGTVNALPTITLGTVTNVSTTATSFSLPYSGTSGSPDQYSITAGTPTAMPSFTAVNNATLGSSPISVAIPASAANTYNFNATVRNSTTGCVSSANAFTVQVVPAVPTITSFTPTSGNVGSLVTITGTNLSSPTGLTIGGVSAIPISNTGTSLVAMVMPGATTGAVSVTTAGGTANGTGNFTVTASQASNTQQGSKLVGTGAVGNANQVISVSLSADGNTAIVGGPTDNSSAGAAWVYTRSGGSWSQQGSKLVGTGAVGNANQGRSVSLSADGNTAIVGGYGDNGGAGAAWVFTRSGGSWSQQGSKLVGTGAVGNAQQGVSVSLSADGNTAIVGGFTDNSYTGAAWVYTRSGGSWSQQGSKLVGRGARGSAGQGNSVSLSADGNTAIVGGYTDNINAGAAWVYTLSGGSWSQQGSKLVGTGAGDIAAQGYSVSLSADGNTAIVGGPTHNSNAGAAWVYTRSGGSWSQQGSKLVGTGAVGSAGQGVSVSLSADGNTAIVGGNNDNNGAGAAWVYTRSGGSWSQQGSKLVGTGAVGGAYQGTSASLSADGNTAIVGGNNDNNGAGAAWVYVYAPPTITTSGTLAAVNTTYGIASTNTSFIVNANGLTDNLVVTAPTGYQVSTSAGSGFASSVNVTPSRGTVTSTTIFVRIPSTTAVGTYTGNVVCSSTGATSQNVATASSIVSAAALTITANNANKNYGSTLSGAAGSTSFTSSGLVNSETIGSVTVAYGTGAAATASVGTYTGSVTPSAATGGTFTASNYNITYATGNIVVGQATLTITASAASKTYGTVASLTAYTTSGLVGTDAVSGLTLSSTGSPSAATVGSYDIVPSGATGTGLTNYAITYTNGTLTVNPAPLTITAVNQVKCFGLNYMLPTNGYSVSGLLMADGVSAVTLTSSGSPSAAAANTYPIVPSAATGTGLSNYSITYNNATLTVNPAPSPSTITLPSLVCTGSGYTLTNSLSGGVWSSSNMGVATINASGGLVTPVSQGNTTISYVVTNNFGCLGTVTALLPVLSTPVKPVITRDFSGNLNSSYSGVNIWYNASNQQTVSGVSSSSYNPKATIRVQVQGNNGGCIGPWSDEFVYTTSSIAILYPNPAKSYTLASIVSDRAQSITLQLTDIAGKLLQEIPVTLSTGQNTVRINTATLARGSYMLVIKGSGVTYMQFVKE